MKNGKYYGLATGDGMVDISGGSVTQSAGKDRYKKGGNKNKIIIISSIAAAVLVVAAVVCFFMFMPKNGGGQPEPEDNTPKEFLFAANTAVSGCDISGMTMQEAKTTLEKNKESFISPIKILVEVGGESVELTQDKFEYTYNIDEVLAKLKQDTELETKNTSDTTAPVADSGYKVTATVTPESIDARVSEICETYDKDPVDAYVTDFHPYEDKRFDFAEAVSGLKVDKADLQTKVQSAFDNKQNYCTVAARTDEIQADVTSDFLKNNLVKLSSYETYSTNTANGTSNMKVALESCNGSIINPGEQWSFNECTGDSNLESNGYKSAHVISEGKIIDGIGGGICQSSSTIYNAAIRANMEIVERYNHQWASAYVPTGLDATIDYPNLDLTLKNVSGYQMFLECKLVDYTLYASFWGYQDPSYDEIKTANEITGSDGGHYSVSAWRIYYKDGKKVNQEELPSSRYDSSNGQIFIAAETDTGDVDRDVDDLNDTPPAQASQEQPAQQSQEVVETPEPQSSQEAVSEVAQETPTAETPAEPETPQVPETPETPEPPTE